MFRSEKIRIWKEKLFFMKKTYIIGISGATGSGKSTFSDNLKNYLSDYKVRVIHMDEYYKEESQRPKVKGISDGKEYIDDNHPMAFDLEQCYMDIQKAMNIDYDILIIEGIFAFWDKRIFDILDLKIFVDCDSDERLVRRISRHLSFGQNLEEITSRYVQAVQLRQKEYVEPTKWKADIILNGFLQPSIGTEIIVNWIKTSYKDFL